MESTSNKQNLEYFSATNSFDPSLIDIKPITAATIKKDEKSPQITLFVSMKNKGPVQFKTDNIIMAENGSITWTDKLSQFYKGENDPKRFFINIPCDKSQQNINNLIKFATDIDDYLTSDKFKNYCFDYYIKSMGKLIFSYSPLYKVNNKVSPDGERIFLDRIRAKFQTEYKPIQTDETPRILTPVYINKKLLTKKDEDDNKPVELRIKSFADIEENIKQHTNLRLVLSIMKIWVKKPLPSNKILEYGCILKVQQLYILNKNSNEFNKHRCAFGDAELITDIIPDKILDKKTKLKQQKYNKFDDLSDSDKSEDSEEELSEESEEETSESEEEEEKKEEEKKNKIIEKKKLIKSPTNRTMIIKKEKNPKEILKKDIPEKKLKKKIIVEKNKITKNFNSRRPSPPPSKIDDELSDKTEDSEEESEN